MTKGPGDRTMAPSTAAGVQLASENKNIILDESTNIEKTRPFFWVFKKTFWKKIKNSKTGFW